MHLKENTFTVTRQKNRIIFHEKHLNQITTSVYLLGKTGENSFAEAALAFLFP